MPIRMVDLANVNLGRWVGYLVIHIWGRIFLWHARVWFGFALLLLLAGSEAALLHYLISGFAAAWPGQASAGAS